MVEHFNVDKIIGTAKNRVHRVGIELEGGWVKVPDGEEFVRDGSVKIEPPVDPNAPSNTSSQRYDAIRACVENWNRQVAVGRRVIIDEDFPLGERWFDYRGRIINIQDHGGFYEYLSMNVRSNKVKIHIGEIPGRILEPKEIDSWMKRCYPEHVNDTCGLHVHMSFVKSLHYGRLMVPEYQATILTYLGKWAMNESIPKDHPIWSRLSGKNEFCKHEFFADVQARKTSKVYDHHGNGNRYTAINYCHGQHGTLECRVLPMFEKVDQAIRAVHQVIDVTNACLKFQAKREEKVNARVIDSIDQVEKHPNTEYV